MNFEKTPQTVQEILKTIAKTPLGRKTLEVFLPRYESKKIAITPYPLHVVEQLRAVIGAGQPIGACFVNDGKTGTIYFDQTSPLGVLAPFVFHEIVHSLDSSVWDASRRPLNRKAKDEVLLCAESKAFEYQHRYIEELKEAYPEYQAFLNRYYPKAKVLCDRLTSTEIADLYGFKTSA